MFQRSMDSLILWNQFLILWVKPSVGSQTWACVGGISKFHVTLKIIVSLTSFLMSLPSTIYTLGVLKHRITHMKLNTIFWDGQKFIWVFQNILPKSQVNFQPAASWKWVKKNRNLVFRELVSQLQGRQHNISIDWLGEESHIQKIGSFHCWWEG